MRRKQLLWKIKSNFECQRCNKCCEQPGFVFITGKDINRIADHLHMQKEAFLELHTFEEEGQRVLKMKEGGACIFLEAQGCSIHSVKPQQCRDFPMKWRDEESFDYCEGIKKLKTLMKNEISPEKEVRHGKQ